MAGVGAGGGSTAGATGVRTITEENTTESDDDSVQDFSTRLGNSRDRGGRAAGSNEASTGRGADKRVPALLALLHLARGVPPEAMSQELEAVVVALVQALGSEYPPLQAAALETFQVAEAVERAGEERGGRGQRRPAESLELLVVLVVGSGEGGVLGGGGRGGGRDVGNGVGGGGDGCMG